MNIGLKVQPIFDGVSFNTVVDERFKTNRISINFITELTQKNVTVNSIIPHLLKKGYKDCENFTEFNRRLQELYGAYVDGYSFKSGDYQILSLSITCVDDKFSLDGDTITDKAAKILCKLALSPVLENGAFVKQEVELEKTALIDTIEAEINEKRAYAMNRLVRLMCKNEPFGIPKYGYKDTAYSLTPEKIKSAYDNLLETAKIEIMFTGCGDDSVAFNAFTAAFSAVKRNYMPLDDIVIHKTIQSIEETEHMTVSQSKLVMGLSNQLPTDHKLVTATKLMVAILGGTPSSKLFVNVREKLSLCYYCATRYDRFKGIMIIDSGVETKNIDEAKKQILNQLDDIKSGIITDEEIKNASLSIVNSLNSVFDSDSSIEAWYMGQRLSGTNETPHDETVKFSKVTKDDIIEAANRFALDATFILTENEI